jgi:ABC-type branched-subunit amino acid transport system ATPase component/branched-subunit amino acid ABC-type transport system permease component
VEIIRFALLGIATGAIYAVLAQGLVLVYRGSGLLNFAQGAMAMVGAYVYYELTVKAGLPLALGLIGAVVFCAALGAAIHLLLLAPMHRASPLSRVIVTLGLLVVFQSAAVIVFGVSPLAVPSLLPTNTVHVFSHKLALGEDRIFIFLIGAVLTAGLWWFYRTSSFGRVTTAVAENQLVAASLGHSPDLIAAINWALGSALAAIAGVLIAPILFLEPTTIPLLVLPAMAAALLGQFASFPLTFAMAMVIGIAESEITRYVSAPGWPTAAPFIAVIVLLVARGTSLPLRSFVLDRLPVVSSGRIRPLPAIVLLAAAVIAVAQADPTWAIALTTTFAVAIICLSIVVVTGYAGQLSLAQYVLAGIGALIAAKLSLHMSFVPAAVLAVAATSAVGAAIGIPALRTRGITLAIVTLGLGASVFDVVLSNSNYTGGVEGVLVPIPHLFGWNIDPFAHPSRYALVALATLALLCLAVMNVRRGVVGRRLLAVRSNERAAASLGVNVAATKSYAFVLGAAIAAVGGILLVFMQPSVIVSGFDVFTSIFVAAVTVAGAVGSVGGALIGSLLFQGGVLSQLFSGWSKINEYLPLIGGVILLAILRADPNGLLHAIRRLLGSVARPFAPRLRRARQRLLALIPRQRLAGVHGVVGAAPAQNAPRVAAKPLLVRDIAVSFGGVHAVRGVSLEVRPGEVHGLIGPNGAGKTTLIDAITGFNKPSSGSVLVGDLDVTGLSPRRRARAGLARSFQSLELFDDLTVLENLAVACEQPKPWQYGADLVRPERIRLTEAAFDAMQQFELADVATRKPAEISFGRRKEVAIARAVASAPSVLLLDEPAAGLDDHEAAEFAELIRRLAKDRGIAVLLVEHKIDMIMSVSDRVSVLVGGSILTSGSPQEVRSDPAVLDAYLGRAAGEAQDATVSARG